MMLIESAMVSAVVVIILIRVLAVAIMMRPVIAIFVMPAILKKRIVVRIMAIFIMISPVPVSVESLFDLVNVINLLGITLFVFALLMFARCPR